MQKREESGKRLPSELPCLLEVDSAIKVSKEGAEQLALVVAVEEPVNISFNDIYYTASSISPCDLEDYAYGIAFSAGFIESCADIVSVDIAAEGKPIDICIKLRKGLGLSDKDYKLSPISGLRHGEHLIEATDDSSALSDSSQDNASLIPRVPSQPKSLLSPTAIWRVSNDLLPAQTMHQATGATHAAVFADYEGNMLYMREDVGRHSVVDKLIGALLCADVDPEDGFIFLSSRCALELVIKCERFGVKTIATVSAPTSAVLEYAERRGLTLCAFSRGNRFTIYTHPERIDLNNLPTIETS